jgi:hypothetical protein
MKKQLLIIFVFFTSLIFSQSPSQKIQSYINNNYESLNLSFSETSNWILESETSSETTGISNCLILQTHNNIKINNNFIYFWIKNNEVINKPEGFIKNISQKANSNQASLNVLEGFSKALLILNETNFSSNIISSDVNKYKLSNGILSDDPVNAELVYFLIDEKLVLTWSYEFYSQNTKHLWQVKIDAISGALLEKRDLVHNCSFGPKQSHAGCMDKQVVFSSNLLFKEQSENTILTPGTTSYKVIPWNYESPFHSSRQLITNPEATTALAPLTVAASPNGWHNTNTTIGGGTAITQYAITRGNNVYAKDDIDGNNTGGISPSGGTYPNLTFDFPYGGNADQPSAYMDAAITNLFYQNNIMHDLWYQYGFNEANRNFQAVNYGRGGSGNDAVVAEAQDGSTLATPNLNNANFSAPSDGSAPRMQMYLWNARKPSKLIINSGILAGTNYNVNDNAFNPGHVNLPLTPNSLTNNLVLYVDATPDTSDACEAPTNAAALNGKIAVIRRGSCTFAIKVKKAQDAGAIAAIIVNNVAGGISMAGADASITIPAVSMSQVDGEALITAMNSGLVNVSLSSPEVYVNGDGDFDNGIIAHEYTHGISGRLVGGGAGLNSSEQPGEGWSDWAWLMMQIKAGDTRNDNRGIGTFAVNQPNNGLGIREYKYSTNMTINPHTFASTNAMWYTDANGIDQIDVHAVGSVWCVILWDLAWNYIEKYGFDSNIYNGTGGNNKVMRLVIDAMKLTPANPTLIQCRNAIIQADLNTTNGQNYCLIWSTFARRGMGVNAASGTNSGSSGIQDQVEDFTEPTPGSTPATGSNCTLGNEYFQSSNHFNIYPNPSNGLLNININNYAGKLQIKVYDINGREVFSQNSIDFNTFSSINLESLSAGMYILKLQGEDLNYSEKIILE